MLVPYQSTCSNLAIIWKWREGALPDGQLDGEVGKRDTIAKIYYYRTSIKYEVDGLFWECIFGLTTGQSGTKWKIVNTTVVKIEALAIASLWGECLRICCIEVAESWCRMAYSELGTALFTVGSNTYVVSERQHKQHSSNFRFQCQRNRKKSLFSFIQLWNTKLEGLTRESTWRR